MTWETSSLKCPYTYLYMWVNVFMYIFQRQTLDLLDQILQALVPASLSGTLL